jgi:hypothetical protein
VGKNIARFIGIMDNNTITVGKVVLSKEGISIRKWSRKEQFIAWNDVQKIGSSRNLLKIWYTTQAGNIRIISIGKDQKKPRNTLLNYWKEILIEKTAAKGELSGSIYLEAWPLKIGAVLGSVVGIYLVYGIYVAIKAYLRAPPEMTLLATWATYYGVTSFGLVLLCIVLSLSNIIQLFHLRKTWKTWKIGRKGLFIQRESEKWEKVEFKAGDRISNHKIIVGGKQIPYSLFTKNIIVPYLLGILAKWQGIFPVPGKGHFSKEAFRLFVFWPFAIAVFWYCSSLFWEVPKFLDLKIGLNLLIIFGSCFVSGIGLLMAYGVETIKYRKGFPEFIAQMNVIQQKLGWFDQTIMLSNN